MARTWFSLYQISIDMMTTTCLRRRVSANQITIYSSRYHRMKKEASSSRTGATSTLHMLQWTILRRRIRERGCMSSLTRSIAIVLRPARCIGTLFRTSMTMKKSHSRNTSRLTWSTSLRILSCKQLTHLAYHPPTH